MSSAFICGCAATMLTPDERALFAEARPWGLICSGAILRVRSRCGT